MKSEVSAMDDDQKAVAASGLSAAYDGSLTFPEIVRRLEEAGFESYAIDFRRRTAIYYLPNGEAHELSIPKHNAPIAATFDEHTIKAAIHEAQSGSAGYTYEGFCEKVMRAGCVGYIVSFSGRRAIYFGRTAETHVEHFPA